MYNKANQWKTYTGENPASGITEFKEQKRDRILNPDEFARFFKALDDEEQNFKDFVILALLTGQRKSNVLAMSWNQIDHEGGTWTIPGEQMKNEQSMSIKLTDIERQILKRRSDKKENLFFQAREGLAIW